MLEIDDKINILLLLFKLILMSYFSLYSDEDEIRQGDIIQRLNFSGSSNVGIIITADCDIAKRKYGNRYNWVEVIPARDFLDKIWAREQLHKLIEKQGKGMVEFLNAAIVKMELGLDRLTLHSLCDWLKNESAEGIFNIVDKKPDVNLKKLKAIRVALGYEDDAISNFDRLTTAYELLNQSKENLIVKIQEGLNSFGDGFSDFFFIPDLPINNKDIGYVALFRYIYSIETDNLFLTELDAKIKGDDSFFRIGRLEDRVKFAIIQKLSFVFLRIGMKDHYEKECKASAELLIEHVLNK